LVSCPASCALIFTLCVLQFALGVWRFHMCTPCWAHAVGFRHFAPCIFALDALRFASCSGVLRLAIRLLVGVHTVHSRHVSRLGIGMVLFAKYFRARYTYVWLRRRRALCASRLDVDVLCCVLVHSASCFWLPACPFELALYYVGAFCALRFEIDALAKWLCTPCTFA
jgi:hypothetical protein